MNNSGIVTLFFTIIVCIMISALRCDAATYIGPVPTYSGSEVAKYAKKYSKSYNENYHKFSSDCTNFASQCVYAGGKRMDGVSPKMIPRIGGKTVSDSKKWYYLNGKGRSNYICTTSWVRCSGKNAFNNYWNSYRVGTYKDLKNVRSSASVGDVIQIVLSDGTLKHSIIVTKKDKGDSEIYCSSHTSDYYNDSLASISRRANKSWGKVKYAIFHFS